MLFFQPAGLVKGITGKREPMKTESMKDSHNEAEEGHFNFDFIVRLYNAVIIIWSVFFAFYPCTTYRFAVLGLEEPSIRRLEPLKAAEELNGTFKSTEPDKAQQDLDVQRATAQSHAVENGLSETDPPHGSTVGSNGYILSKAQDDSPATQHRTNWSPKGTSPVGYAAKTLPLSSTSQTQGQGALRTNTSTGPSLAEGRLENETKNGTATNTPPRVTVHRARKTMSRPASNHALKVMCGSTHNLKLEVDKDSESKYWYKPFLVESVLLWTQDL